MHGRMIHIRKNGEYVRQPQIYDARGRVSTVWSHAIDLMLIWVEFVGYGSDRFEQDLA